jgi:hypothetical protein
MGLGLVLPYADALFSHNDLRESLAFCKGSNPPAREGQKSDPLETNLFHVNEPRARA